MDPGKPDCSLAETAAVAKHKKIASELEMLLPNLFERLKPINGFRLSKYQSHHEYLEFFMQQCLDRKIDTYELESNWMRALFGSSQHAKVLYQAACHELIQSHRVMNCDSVDESSIDGFSVNMQLMIRAIHDLSAMEILSPKEAAIRQASAGGVGRARSFDPAKKKLVELLASNAPASGWRTKSDALKAIEQPLGQFIEENNIGLKLDAVISTAARWARNDREIAAAFERHVNRKPKMRNGRTEQPVRN